MEMSDNYFYKKLFYVIEAFVLTKQFFIHNKKMKKKTPSQYLPNQKRIIGLKC